MKKTKKMTRLLAVLLTFCLTLSLLPVTAFAAEPTDIGRVEFTYTHPHYKTGDIPQASARVTNSDAHCKVAYECLEEVEDDPEEPNTVVSTGRYWYSSPNEMARLDPKNQITQLESGQKFLYSVVLEVENSSYRFNKDTTVVSSNGYELGTPEQNGLLEVQDWNLRLKYCDYILVDVLDDDEPITEASVEEIKFNYEAGEAPQKTAKPFFWDDVEQYVVYECWEEMDDGNPVAFWYSDESRYTSSMKRITKFEEGKKYMYSMELKAKDGYTFADNCSVSINNIPTDAANVIKNQNGLFITAIKTIAPVTPKEIEVVEINNATLTFKDGDKPVFTGTTPDDAPYFKRFEAWRTDGAGISSAEWFNNDDHLPYWGGKLITTFDKNKTYTYEFYATTTAEGSVNGWYFGPNTKLKVNGKEVAFDRDSDDNEQQFSVKIKLTMKPASAPSAISKASISNVKLDYKPGDAPQATAKAAANDTDKYDILYECWEKREKDANDTISTVAYWYSDESYYSDDDVRFNTFEKGGRYKYSVRLQAKDGYTFDSNLSDENVTLNGASLPFGSWVNVLDDGKTCLITYGIDTRPGQVIEKINFSALTNFDAGDKPRFSTGVVDPFVDTDHQRWDANDGSGYGITSSEFWNTRYNGKLITKFEAGKSYTYGVYFRISDLGMEEGYRFDKTTKLYINGEEITLTPDQIDVDDSGETIWFSNVLTMTPTPTVSWQKIDVVEIEGATVNFKDGDKPVFTGKTPENAPYIYQFECWETKDGAGVNSAEFFDNAYEKHITAFKGGETYQYILYLKAERGYYFTADTKIKINGTLYDYRLVNIDPGYDETGKMFTFWAYTDLTMTPESSGKVPEYKITEGANGSWTQNSDGTLTFRANGDLSKFTGVKVDGTLIAADKYTAASGSTVITLKTDYLKTLSVGIHKLTVVYTDGDCSTDFEIKKASSKQAEPTENNNKASGAKSDSNTINPNTGDNNDVMLELAVFFVSAAGILVYGKKKRNIK